MDDNELERRLVELKETWRVPRDPPLEEIWQTVEARAFPLGTRRQPWRWTRTLLPLAAMLLLGFGIGQLTPAVLRQQVTATPVGAVRTTGSTPVSEASARSSSDAAPFVGIATDYLERVTALLVTLADANRAGKPLGNSAGQARDLLATTRLLLDSPQASDPHLQALLNDLELVLAQIARLPQRAAQPDVYLIDETLDQREVLPRLRELLAENTASQP
ncbi:MAG TPA: hypothetical protein VGQ69_12095 [Gemmatimonadales bacterium]|jgi:hypothetical protein|nr:hypothetical protein [Gemmatimonadales bacterium]